MLQTGYVLYFEPIALSIPVYMKEHIVERGDRWSNVDEVDEETVVTHTEIRPLFWHGQRLNVNDALRKLLVD
jgi:hypothetical protein